MNKLEQNVTVTLDTLQWHHVLAGLRVGFDALVEQRVERPEAYERPEIQVAIERFGDPLNTVPDAHDAIRDAVEAETGLSGFFGDLINS